MQRGVNTGPNCPDKTQRFFSGEKGEFTDTHASLFHFLLIEEAVKHHNYFGQYGHPDDVTIFSLILERVCVLYTFSGPFRCLNILDIFIASKVEIFLNAVFSGFHWICGYEKNIQL